MNEYFGETMDISTYLITVSASIATTASTITVSTTATVISTASAEAHN